MRKTIIGIFVIGVIFINGTIIGNFDGASQNFGLYTLANLTKANAEDTETTGTKYARRDVSTATLTETVELENGTIVWKRTCKYRHVICTGTGDEDCTPSFTLIEASCSNWVLQS